MDPGIMIFKLVSLFLLLGTGCEALTPEQVTSIDALVRDVFMANNQIPGVGLSVVENGGNSVFAKGYGFADVSNNILSTNTTKFCIASVTKTFTATILMKVLSERFPELGERALDIPIKQLHPNGNFTFSDRYRSESMSFRDLLSHRHGLRTESLGSSAGAYKDLEEFTYRSRYAKEVGPFRSAGYYSNTLYALIGKLASEIAGMPYESLLENLFQDIGMSESILIKEDVDYYSVENMSKGYYLKDGEIMVLNSSLINRVFVGAPAGAIITTAVDMTKYIAFHLNLGKVGDEQVISEAAMGWMRGPAFPVDLLQFKDTESSIMSGGYAIGTGFMLGVFDGWRFLLHNGQWTTFMSELRIYPELNFGTFSVNNGPSEIGDVAYGHTYLHNEIYKIVHDMSSSTLLSVTKLAPHPRTTSKLAKKPKVTNMNLLKKKASSLGPNQEQFVGIYGHPVEGELEIRNPNGTLYLQFGKWATGYLIPFPNFPDTFTINFDSAFVEDIYFGAGTLIDVYVQFLDINTLGIIFLDTGYIFERDAILISFPEIPWSADSCGPTKII